MVLNVKIDYPSSIDNNNLHSTKINQIISTTKPTSSTGAVPTAASNEAVTGTTVPPRFDDDSESPEAFTIRALELFHLDSNLRPIREVPTIASQEDPDVEVGARLGEGGFSIVSAVKLLGGGGGMQLVNDDDINNSNEQWVIKSLRPEIIQGPMSTFKIAAADLWKEAEFLAALDHPGIVRIRAKHLTLDALDENFIIVERIQITLDDKLLEWREADQKARNVPELRLKLLKERLKVCLEICEILKYLHSQDVVYRDLKSANFGFDKEGRVKLFGKFSLQRLWTMLRRCWYMVQYHKSRRVLLQLNRVHD